MFSNHTIEPSPCVFFSLVFSKPRNGQWDMGHIPGQKYSVVHAKYINEMMTPEEFLQWYRDPRNYRPELPSTNRSHKYE